MPRDVVEYLVDAGLVEKIQDTAAAETVQAQMPTWMSYAYAALLTCRARATDEYGERWYPWGAGPGMFTCLCEAEGFVDAIKAALALMQDGDGYLFEADTGGVVTHLTGIVRTTLESLPIEEWEMRARVKLLCRGESKGGHLIDLNYIILIILYLFLSEINMRAARAVILSRGKGRQKYRLSAPRHPLPSAWLPRDAPGREMLPGEVLARL